MNCEYYNHMTIREKGAISPRINDCPLNTSIGLWRCINIQHTAEPSEILTISKIYFRYLIRQYNFKNWYPDDDEKLKDTWNYSKGFLEDLKLLISHDENEIIIKNINKTEWWKGL